RIAYISGYNSLGQWDQAQTSYFACRRGSIWGWATWKRAWQHVDFTLARFRSWEIEAILANHLPDPEHVAYQAWSFHHYSGMVIDAWGIQWALACLLSGGLCLMPSHNLVRNLGFHVAATHTIDPFDMRSDLPGSTIALPLVHPDPAQLSAPDDQFDRWVFLLTLMNSYKDARTLRLWQQLLDKSPTLELPGLNAGFAHVLTPLRHPVEALEVLIYWQKTLGANERLQQLIQAFRAMVEQGA
ncbi:MAG: hypothetical protein NT075_00080, partial [Chloroflexi bacterium]|nr:hypothetical protein [Chloroflexota bacterium]